MTLYENDNYIIEAVTNEDNPVEMFGSKYFSYYEMRNKHTNVVEIRTPVLPEAIHNAVHHNMTMENKPWEWAEAGNPELAGLMVGTDDDDEVH